MDQQMPSGEELNRLVGAIAATQDRQAFALLFKHFGPRVKAYLMRCGAAANIAEELTQEAMLSVWRKASYFDPSRGGVSTWIFTIARNLRLDLQRKTREPKAIYGDPTDEPDQSPSPEAIILAAEREARVQTALAALSQEQATIVRLSFFAEKPHTELAHELGIPLGTVKSRVRLAMARLRILLEQER